MSILLPKPAITPQQKRLALIVAAVADALQLLSIPVYLFGGYAFDDVLDLIVAAVLFFMFGFRWQFALVFAIELLPIADLCPTWTIFVATLPVDKPAPNVTASTVPPTQPTSPTVTPPPIFLPPAQNPDIIDAEVIDKN